MQNVFTEQNIVITGLKNMVLVMLKIDSLRDFINLYPMDKI